MGLPCGQFWNIPCFTQTTRITKTTSTSALENRVQTIGRLFKSQLLASVHKTSAVFSEFLVFALHTFTEPLFHPCFSFTCIQWFANRVQRFVHKSFWFVLLLIFLMLDWNKTTSAKGINGGLICYVVIAIDKKPINVRPKPLSSSLLSLLCL